MKDNVGKASGQEGIKTKSIMINERVKKENETAEWEDENSL